MEFTQENYAGPQITYRIIIIEKPLDLEDDNELEENLENKIKLHK
jgi:hypothetical protein